MVWHGVGTGDFAAVFLSGAVEPLGRVGSAATCQLTSWPADSGLGMCLPQAVRVESLLDVAQAGGVFCSGTLPCDGSHLKELKSTHCPHIPGYKEVWRIRDIFRYNFSNLQKEGSSAMDINNSLQLYSPAGNIRYCLLPYMPRYVDRDACVCV